MSENTPPDPPPPGAGLAPERSAAFMRLSAVRSAIRNAPGPPESDGVAAVPVSAPVQSPKPTPGASVAEPFEMVTFDQALARAGAVTVAEVRRWLRKLEDERRMLFDECRGECREVAIVREPAAVPPALWIVGDLHADVLTLANILAHAERSAANGERPAFVLLGDFVDRGLHDHETLLLLFQLVMDHPERVCIIPGNHDIDLRWDDAANKFKVTIEPAEYCDRLNGLLGHDDPAAREEVELAQLLIPFWQSRPKAVVLPDGTLLAHGGFPHTDLHDALRSPANLGDPKCVSDFMWARLSESPKKRPNRGNRGHEFGWKDFALFCKKSEEIGLPPVKRFVRGHDHVPVRWHRPRAYGDCPVLTLNAMGRRMDTEPPPDNGAHPYPVMARHVPGQLPEVVLLPLDPVEVGKAFGSNPARVTDTPAFDEFSIGGPLVERPAPRVEPGGAL
jgi:hypothetical protein